MSPGLSVIGLPHEERKRCSPEGGRRATKRAYVARTWLRSDAVQPPAGRPLRSSQGWRGHPAAQAHVLEADGQFRCPGGRGRIGTPAHTRELPLEAAGVALGELREAVANDPRPVAVIVPRRDARLLLE